MHTEVITLTLKKIAMISFPINFIWEMGQMPFYSGMSYNLANTLFCLVASIGDVFMIIMIFFGVAFLTKDYNWVYKSTLRQYGLAMIVGLFLAIFVEYFALKLGLWQYSYRMPLITNTGIGIIPLLQMVVLPSVVFNFLRYSTHGY